MSRSARQIELTETFAAHNYDPLPVVASHGDGCWVTDVDGRRYLDCLAAYSALNFGHRHPALIEAARAQLDRFDLDQSRLLQRPASAPSVEICGTGRYGVRLADEHRRRGCRDCDQGGAPLGV